MKNYNQKLKKLAGQITLGALGCLFGMLLAKTVKAQDLDNALLWEISGNGLESPSYLYGTIHVICSEDLVLTEKMKSAMDDTDRLVMELDMDQPNFMATMQQKMMNPNMKNLSSEFTEEELEVVNSFYKTNYGADLSQLGVMKPIALLSMMFPKALDCEQQGSFEAALMQQNGDKEILGLETVERQLSVFDNDIPTEDQIDWIVEYAGDMERLKQEFSSLIDAYKNQDLNKMYALMLEQPQYEQYLTPLLYDRNEEWIEKIEKFVNGSPTFIAVGAAHLASDKGVINLLREEGYNVEAVK